MPFTAADLIATPGAPDANSYVSLDAFTAASERELVSASVEDAFPDDAARALAQATARLDEERFIGTRATDAQALAWPRTDAVDVYGVLWPDGIIPGPVVRATILLARHYLDRRTADLDADASAPDEAARIKRIKAGEIEVEYQPASGEPLGSASSPTGGDMPASVLRALLGLVIAASTPDSGAKVGSFAWVR